MMSRLMNYFKAQEKTTTNSTMVKRACRIPKYLSSDTKDEIKPYPKKVEVFTPEDETFSKFSGISKLFNKSWSMLQLQGWEQHYQKEQIPYGIHIFSSLKISNKNILKNILEI